MKKYGFVASGGGYRSFYTAGALVWLKENGIEVSHITSASSGNNIALDYLLWDKQKEALPPVLTRTMRLGVGDIFHVFKNFLGLALAGVIRHPSLNGLLPLPALLPAPAVRRGFLLQPQCHP